MMNNRIEAELPDSQGRRTRIRHYLWGLVLSWSLLLAGLLSWDFISIQSNTEELALKEARANFNKDQAFRHWAAGHGGVYVPTTESTPPNPHLAHIPERDIRTPSGKALTLMNPAYIVRQFNEEYAEWFGVQGHITSTRVLRPGNEPDPWERLALESFERGEKEVVAFSEIGGEPYLRLMQPMITKKRCLKCHGFQGYQVGDVRGGVSVSVPLAAYQEQRKRTMLRDGLSFGVVWLLGSVGMLVAGRRLERDEMQRREAERLLRRANEDLDQYAQVASHQLQEPLRLIASYTQLLRQRYQHRLGQDADDYIRYAVGGTVRMQQLIEDLLHYSRLGSEPPRLLPTDSRLVADQVRDGLEGEIGEKGAEVELGPMPIVPIESQHLAILIRHLLENALKFHAEQPPKIRIECRREKDAFHFTVTDNGIGIDPAHHQRIFKLFGQLRREEEFPGTGIGLAHCKKLVELYGGRIWLESSLGAGAVFHFTLPTVVA
ncbi:MAG: DUF3365 domain-containing protein [Candidatus Thiodiazotropha sp. (ex Epidulcina cf. delphinae)]|nr:DUF3365 domain-containing protein [Candidatus Thiodiazotropha sp. (ex Epidulcina cf. delphinae)]